MPVEGAEVTYVHDFEHVLLMAYGRLDGVVEAYDALPTGIVQVAAGKQPLRCLGPQTVVGGVGIEAKEILLHATHRTIDAHIVVVEDDEQVVWRRRNIV